MPELLADPVVEARARDLGQRGDAVAEAHLRRGAGGELGDRVAVDGDVDRVAPGRVADPKHVAGGDDERPRGQRVRGDVADHVALDPPGEDRAAVGEVVAGGSGRGRGDQPVAAHVADLLAGDRVAQLGQPRVRAAAEGDVVERERRRPSPRPRGRAARSPRRSPRRPASQALGDPLPLDGGEEPDRAEVDPEDRHPGAGVAPQRPEDRAVAAEHQAEVGVARAARRRRSIPSAAAPCFSASSGVATSSAPASRPPRSAAATASR